MPLLGGLALNDRLIVVDHRRRRRLITHRFKLDKILDAYDTFGRAASTGALKVLIEA